MQAPSTPRWRTRRTATMARPTSLLAACRVGASTSAPRAELQAATCTARSRSSDSSPFQKAGSARGRAAGWTAGPGGGSWGWARSSCRPSRHRIATMAAGTRAATASRAPGSSPEIQPSGANRLAQRGYGRALPGAQVEGDHGDREQEREGEAERDQPQGGRREPGGAVGASLGQRRQHPVREVHQHERQEEQPQRPRGGSGREAAPGVRLEPTGVAVRRCAAGVPPPVEAGAPVAALALEQVGRVGEHRRAGVPLTPWTRSWVSPWTEWSTPLVCGPCSVKAAS